MADRHYEGGKLVTETKSAKLVIWEMKRDKLRRKVAALRGKLNSAQAELSQAELAVATLEKRKVVGCEHCNHTGEEWIVVAGGRKWTGEPCPHCSVEKGKVTA